MANVDPGGKLLNRPAASLARILLPWRPQTYASARERIQLIDRIIGRLPKVGWKLLLAIAPTMHGTTHRTAMPKWRDFATREPEIITHQSLGAMYAEIGKRLIAAAGDSSERWIDLVDHWAHFDAPWQEQALAALEAAVAQMSAADRSALRGKLRDFIGKHSRFPDAHWSLNGAQLEPLRQLFDDLVPGDAAERHKWLFAVAMPRFDTSLDYEEWVRLIDKERVAAATEIAEELPVDKLVEFAAGLARPDLLGWALAGTHVDRNYIEQALALAFAQDEQPMSRLASGILGRLASQDGKDAISERFRKALAEQKPAYELLAISFVLDADPTTWALIASAGEEVEAAYWKKLGIFAIPRDTDLDFVAERLLRAGRGRGLLAFLAADDKLEVRGDLIVRALRYDSTINAPEEQEEHDADGMSSYYIGKLFERLDRLPEMREEVLYLEWIYYRALEQSERPPRMINERLATDPDFFVLLMTHLYRAAGADEEVIEDDDARERENTVASQAYHVMQNWDRVPGSDENGNIDGAELKKWVRGARAGCSMVDRADIGDYRIGVILSAAGRQAGEPWPPEPVRDVIDEIANDDVEQGVSIGLFNRRGVTTRMPNDGGTIERREAARYRDDAKASAILWPRTAALLNRIADQYEADAMREDQRAEQRDW